jgi:hypothetical protein
MSTNIITSEVQFKSGYKVRIFLVPVTVINPAAGTDMIRLTVSGNKILPGIAEGETWTFSTDDPEQEIAETIAGKFGGVNALSFEVPYDPMLQAKLVEHAATNFTVRVVYDDAQLPMIYCIEVKDSFLTTPGSTSGTANNAAPTMTITAQPRGGGLIRDCIRVTAAPRA